METQNVQLRHSMQSTTIPNPHSGRSSVKAQVWHLSGEGLASNSGGAALSPDPGRLHCCCVVRAHLCETDLGLDRLEGRCRRGVFRATEKPLCLREMG